MSAIVCGKRIERSFLEDLPTTPYLSKRFRRSSPIRLSPSTSLPTTLPSSSSSSSSPTDFNNNGSSSNNVDAVNHLSGLFPDIDKEVLGRTLEECGNDLDATIKSLNEICLTANTDSIKNNDELQSHGIASTSGETLYSENPSAPDNLPKSGSEWVELLVSEMTNSSNMDDARARASRVLGILEKSIRANASAEAATNFQMENLVLKEQMQVLLKENTILKRAVAIQHKQQKQHDDRNQELQQLKQLVSQYQELLRTLEVNNYALTMHLRQAEQSSSIPGRFHPDIF